MKSFSTAFSHQFPKAKNLLEQLLYISMIPNLEGLQYIGLGKKKCRIFNRNLTLYLTYLELSDLSQICGVLFANLLPFRSQRHYPPLINLPSLFAKNSDSQFSQTSFEANLVSPRAFCMDRKRW